MLESLSGFISSDIDLAPLKLPLNNYHREGNCTEILKEAHHLGGAKVSAESLYCLEFDVKQALPLLPDFEVDIFGIDLDKEVLSEEELLACDMRMVD